MGDEGGVFMNDIIAFIKETPESSLDPSAVGEATVTRK